MFRLGVSVQSRLRGLAIRETTRETVETNTRKKNGYPFTTFADLSDFLGIIESCTDDLVVGR